MQAIRISLFALAIISLPALMLQSAYAQRGGPGGGFGGPGGGFGGPGGPGGGRGGPGGGPGGHYGAPGPIVGAGLPAFVVGYGVYWLVRRRRKNDQK